MAKLAWHSDTEHTGWTNEGLFLEAFTFLEVGEETTQWASFCG